MKQKPPSIYVGQNTGKEDTTEKTVQDLYKQLTFEDPTLPKFEQSMKIAEQLAKIGLVEQEQPIDTDNIEECKTQLVIRYSLLENKYQSVLKELCALLMLNRAHQINSYVLLVKNYTDSLQLFRLLDKNSLLFIVSEIVSEVRIKSEINREIMTANVYIIYNIFRQIDQLEIGEDDNILRLVVKFDLIARLMKMALDNELNLDRHCIVTLVEALAALCDCEAFMDYCGEILQQDRAELFIRFYDSFVIELLEVESERAKMLCFDDTLSWIRRNRPEVEEK